MPTYYRVHVGPAGADARPSEFASEPIARHALRTLLETTADENPMDAREIDGVIERFEASEGEFLDYFTVAGRRWRARYWS